MKTKVLSIFIATTAIFSGTSHAVSLATAVLANTSVGLVTLDPDGDAGSAIRTTVNGRFIVISTTTALTGVSASMNALLASSTSTPAQFDVALTSLIGVTNPTTSPGIVRSGAFTGGAITSTGAVELGSSGNTTYLFLVAESAGFITGIGSYVGPAVPTAGSITLNPAFVGDTLGVGTSVLSAAIVGPPAQPVSGFQLSPALAVPEPSAALLGVLGALGLLRRRRI